MILSKPKFSENLVQAKTNLVRFYYFPARWKTCVQIILNNSKHTNNTKKDNDSNLLENWWTALNLMF